MFKKDTKKEEETSLSDTIETVIGPSVKIEGNFTSNGNIMVAGVVNGTLSTQQNLRVDESAKIAADIEAHEAVIAGEVQGNVKTHGHLEILATARITGDIVTDSIAIEQGAYINGNCTMANTGTEEVPAPEVEQEGVREASATDEEQLLSSAAAE